MDLKWNILNCCFSSADNLKVTTSGYTHFGKGLYGNSNSVTNEAPRFLLSITEI